MTLGIFEARPICIYGRPVRGNEFIGRQKEVKMISNRISYGDSIIITGRPQIGKTSLLFNIRDKLKENPNFISGKTLLIPSFLDLYSIDDHHEIFTFWDDALEPLKHLSQLQVHEPLQKCINENYSLASLKHLFSDLSDLSYRLVLLLDEFDRVLIHPQLSTPAFFRALHTITANTSALCIVATSYNHVSIINSKISSLVDSKKPFFTDELYLKPFDSAGVGMLFDRANELLSADERRFIRRTAGFHPFLLQAMIASMLETRGPERHSRAAERFYERISFHFADLWNYLDDRTKTVAVILSLVELGGKVYGQKFSFGEIENADEFGNELRKLQEYGVAEQMGYGWQFDWSHYLLWRGESWTISAQAFSWWIRDMIISEFKSPLTPSDWLSKKKYKIFLTEEHWNKISGVVKNAPEWAIRGVGGIAHALFDELIKPKP